MDEAESIIRSFYTGFCLYLVTFTLLLIIIILLFVFRNKPIKNFSINGTKILMYSLIVIFTLATAFICGKTLLYFLDLEYVTKKQFESFTGVVTDYTYIREENDTNNPIYGNLIFKDIDSNETESFNVGPVELGQTYTIIYLKNTKIARIIKK